MNGVKRLCCGESLRIRICSRLLTVQRMRPIPRCCWMIPRPQETADSKKSITKSDWSKQNWDPQTQKDGILNKINNMNQEFCADRISQCPSSIRYPWRKDWVSESLQNTEGNGFPMVSLPPGRIKAKGR